MRLIRFALLALSGAMIARLLRRPETAVPTPPPSLEDLRSIGAV